MNYKTFSNWVNKRKETLEGRSPGITQGDSPEVKALKKRNRELEMENEFLKGTCLLRQGAGIGEKYRLMEAEKADFPIATMARILKVSRSGFYAWLKRKPGPDQWPCLKARIEKLWLESDKVFGQRTVHIGVCKEKGFEDTTLYRVRKRMREMGIFGIQKNSSKKTTVADPKAPTRPDLIKRDFTSAVPTTKLVGDITYLKTGEGWLCLCVVIDLCTRMVVGWAMADHMRASLCVSALGMAHRHGYVAEGAIYHSDCGSQFTSLEHSQFAASIDVRLSVSRTGSCHDNAVAESFFSRLKNERYSRYAYKTRAEAKAAVVSYIEGFYNRRRPHSAIDGQIPAEAMDAFFARADRAFTADAEIDVELMKSLAA